MRTAAAVIGMVVMGAAAVAQAAPAIVVGKWKMVAVSTAAWFFPLSKR